MLMHDSDELLPISAISHYLYCPRQAALIHVEHEFADNVLTIGGDIGHENVNRERGETEIGVRKEYSLRVFSDTYGLTGIADVVEFYPNAAPLPIDYKHGRIAQWINHEAQVVAIAFCLEEMMGVRIEKGAIYHIQSKRRRIFEITVMLRDLTKRTIESLQNMLQNQVVPPAEHSAKCNRCSLIAICMPKLVRATAPDIFEPL
jgi:CRISPR-associated exonuclease Cas4